MACEHGVHLVGSVAMEDAATVFRALSSQLGPWLKRIPDGETGKRHRWIYWQREMLLSHEAMELDPDAPPLVLTQWDGTLIRETELVHFKPGVDPATVVFETGYDDAAIESYGIFQQLQATGEIPAGVRFQVALPTPMASAFMYVSPSARGDFIKAYERGLMKALNNILAAVPHGELAIQWDVCQEVLVFENYFPERPADYKQQIFDQLARLGNAVPADVELGYHLCYATPKDQHLLMPKDTGVMVEIVGGLQAGLGRPMDFLHLPVPADRSDDAFFAPLAGLGLKAGTTLYMGLIHENDDQGNRDRLAAASRVMTNFGVASECGWGRSAPEKVSAMISTHRRMMDEYQPKAG